MAAPVASTFLCGIVLQVSKQIFFFPFRDSLEEFQQNWGFQADVRFMPRF